MLNLIRSDAFNLIDERTACVIIEPVQGEAGIIVPEKDFLNKLREHCDKSGALLIFDEVQTAFGRLGAITASEKYSVTPDIIVLGKALGGGLPLGAFVSSTRIMNTLAFDPPLGHITTFGGHPLSCAAGMASLDYLVREKLAESAENKGMLFRKFLDHSLISEIRGEGLMLAVVPDRGISVPDLVTRAPAFGILIDYFLFCSDAFRIAPPLTISEQEIESACNSIIKLLEDSVK
ncbi:MAG: aminotransferase class III-fold pyridoxal phosphate-dependent enzyme [Bacteroidales bacterium]